MRTGRGRGHATKPQTSGAKSAGRFGKPDFVYLAKDDVYRCPAGEKLAHHFTADEDGQKMRIYLTKACRTCPFKDQCTTSNERRIKRWEHEHVVEAAQTRLDQNPQAMRVRRETVEHPFATLKMRMGATHFLMKTVAQCRDRNGAERTRLQPHAHNEHRRHQAAPGGNPGVKSSCCYAHRVTVQVAQRGPRLRPD